MGKIHSQDMATIRRNAAAIRATLDTLEDALWKGEYENAYKDVERLVKRANKMASDVAIATN